MTREELQEWFEDLKHKLPETAAYYSSLSAETRDEWFGIFSPHALCDALTMNWRMFESGEGTNRFERDRLPSLFRRLLNECKHARQQLEEHDTMADDELSGHRYKCHYCCDTGVVSHEWHGHSYAAACPHCDTGRSRANQKWRSGRTLGYAPGACEDNQFNRALDAFKD
jgi:hypothetical protein